MIIRISEHDADLFGDALVLTNCYWNPELKVDRIFAVAVDEHLLSGRKRYMFIHPSEGWPGNLDHTERLYHGWRGTTDNWRREAIGVRQVLEITQQKNGAYRVKLSDDLHPDWD